MSGEVVNSWDAAVLAVIEGSTTFGTTPDPAAAQSFEFISFDTGPSEVGDIRDKKDRNPGRGMRSDWVEGRVKPIPFSLETSVKSRAAVDTVPREAALMKAAGLVQTVNGATSVVYSLVGDPVQAANLPGISMYRILGKSAYSYEAEQLRGGVVKTMSWSGGDKELTLKAAGEAIGKHHLGWAASVTLADGSGTSLTFGSVEEGLRFGIGWYQIESEIIKITVPSTTSSAVATIVRAQLASTGAAHAAQIMRPYIPTLSYAGSPISEGGTVSITIDSQVIRCLAFNVDFTSGIDLLPGESGSKYIQGPKVVLYDIKAGVRLVMKREDVSLLGKAKLRKAAAVTIIQSTGVAGGVVTFSLPYCEVEPFKVPDTANDVAIIDVGLRVRDNSGNDAMTITYT